MSLGDCKAPGGVRGGSGRLGASIMAQVPSVDPGVGLFGKYGPGLGRFNGEHRRKAACGGTGRAAPGRSAGRACPKGYRRAARNRYVEALRWLDARHSAI
jgi:hypothetical protein